jgi:hypothetical protein
MNIGNGTAKNSMYKIQEKDSPLVFIIKGFYNRHLKKITIQPKSSELKHKL